MLGEGTMADRDRARLLRERRGEHRLSRAQLAVRAAVDEELLAAHEEGHAALSCDGLRGYLVAMGEELIEKDDELHARPIQHRYDEEQIAAQAALPMAERVARALAWDDFAANLIRAHEQRVA
jgi:hypothetical protein